MFKVAYPEEFIEIESTEVHVSNNMCIVSITANVNGELMTFHGESKRHSQDTIDDRIAIFLAYSRALEKMSKKLTKMGNAQLAMNEEMIRARPVQRAQKRKWASGPKKAPVKSYTVGIGLSDLQDMFNTAVSRHIRDSRDVASTQS